MHTHESPIINAGKKIAQMSSRKYMLETVMIFNIIAKNPIGGEQGIPQCVVFGPSQKRNVLMAWAKPNTQR